MPARTERLVSLALGVVAAWALLETRGWAFNTALYPRVVAAAMLLLVGVELLVSRRPGAGNDDTLDMGLSSGESPAVAGRRTLAAFAWLAGFFVAIAAVGMPRAVPLFVFAYLRGQSRESWTTSIVLAAAAWLSIELLFVRLLHLPFANGVLWEMVAR